MAVTEFLRAGISLLQAVVGKGAGSADLDRQIEEFQYFVTRLSHEATLDTAVSAEGVERACWKMSQDILIRLRRLGATRTTSAFETNEMNRDLRSVFTEQDIECLRTQLFAVHTRWQSLQREAEAPL